MTQQVINVGTTANDGTGDQLRTAFTKANTNFTEVYSDIATLNTSLTTLSGTVSGITTFSGIYADLTGKPTIPVDISDLTDTGGLLTHTSLTGYATETYVDSAISSIPTFDQSLNTTDNPQFNRVGLTLGEINVTAGTDFNLYTSPDGVASYNLNYDTAGYLTIDRQVNAEAYNITGIGSVGFNGSDLGLESINNFKLIVGGEVGSLWIFATDGALTLPSGVVLAEGGVMGTGDLNITTTEPGVGTTYDFGIGASDGIWALRFPDGTRQETALQAETVAQTGYRLLIDTDIYANSTGGAVLANETSVDLGSVDTVRGMFDITPLSTSTDARAYADPLATEGQFDPNILEITTVSGAPIEVGMDVWAITSNSTIPLGTIDSQIDATTFRLFGSPLSAEIPLGTRFEFYSGGWSTYDPINPITIFWNSGEETVVTGGKTNNVYSSYINLITVEDQTALTYPIEVATDNYAPAEFSHIIDADNGFKITTVANDFVINASTGPLVIRNAGGDLTFDAVGTLTTPDDLSVGNNLSFNNQMYAGGGILWEDPAGGTTINDVPSNNYFVIVTNTNTIGDRKYFKFGYDGNLALPSAVDANYVIGESEGGLYMTSSAGLVLVAGEGTTDKGVILYENGSLQLPGAVLASSVYPTPGTGTVGAATAITVTNSPNLNWTSTGFNANGIGFVFTVDGSGNATVSEITDGGTGHYVGETFTVVGTILGLSSPDDDINFEVTAIDAGSPTALDLTKQVQIITATASTKFYSLADGTEGQIMYFVPDSTIDTTVFITVANARILDTGGTGYPITTTNYSWTPFHNATVAPDTVSMAIFADGAWCLKGGATD